MTTQEEEIRELCSLAGCKDKQRKTHAHQYLKKRWNPHPSERFLRWWANRGVQATEEATSRGWHSIDAERAYNCEAVREVYRSFLQEQRAEMH